MLYTVNMLWTF